MVQRLNSSVLNSPMMETEACPQLRSPDRLLDQPHAERTEQECENHPADRKAVKLGMLRLHIPRLESMQVLDSMGSNPCLHRPYLAGPNAASSQKLPRCWNFRTRRPPSIQHFSLRSGITRQFKQTEDETASHLMRNGIRRHCRGLPSASRDLAAYFPVSLPTLYFSGGFSCTRTLARSRIPFMKPVWPRLPHPTICWATADADDLDRSGLILSGPEWNALRPASPSRQRAWLRRRVRALFGSPLRHLSW